MAEPELIPWLVMFGTEAEMGVAGDYMGLEVDVEAS